MLKPARRTGSPTLSSLTESNAAETRTPRLKKSKVPTNSMMMIATTSARAKNMPSRVSSVFLIVCSLSGYV